MAVNVYKSTDASAPVLSGSVGALITVLDACLVNGYGSQSSAGWTKAYSGGTTQATYRPGSGVQHYFHFNDTNAVSGGDNETAWHGSETASAFNTGTGFFPSSSQGISSGGWLAVRKSNALSSTAKPWIVVADNRTCYLFSLTGDISSVYFAIGFGEFYSILPTTDLYRSFVTGRAAFASSLSNVERLADLYDKWNSVSSGNYLARAYTGLGTSILFSKFGDNSRGNIGANGTLGVGENGLTAPNGVDGSLHISPVHIGEASGVRGRYRGFYQLCHPASAFGDGNTIAGVGPYAGRTFLVISKGKSSAGNDSTYCLDITGPWETN